MQELSDAVPVSQRLYILRNVDGDYVQSVESGETATVNVRFVFTKDRAQAQRFKETELWEQSNLAVEFACGFSGGTAERVQ
jgi:hypothetical protein